MENNKNKGILPIIIMMIITVCAVIASAVMYGMVLQTNINENDTNTSDKTNATIEENDSENEIEIEEKEVDKFAEYQENYKKSFKTFMEKGYTINIYPQKSEMPGVYRIYIDSNNDAYFQFEKDSQLYNRYGETYRVESNVAKIVMCPNGNGGYADVVFVKLDGTASSVGGYSPEQNPVVKCEKIEGVENAVDVITYLAVDYDDKGEPVIDGPAWNATVFIDINGNIVKEY